MRKLKILIATALLAVMGAAHAQSEFDFAYTGTIVTLCGPTFCPGFPSPIDGPIIEPWTGTISFLTSSSADGTYSCTFGGLCSSDGVLSIGFSNGAFGFNGAFSSSWFPFPLLGGFLNPPLTLTLLDGAIASLKGGFTFVPGAPQCCGYRTDGTTLTYSEDFTDSAPKFSRFASALLTPIPEPETWALLLVGMAAIGGLTRKRRGSDARGASPAGRRRGAWQQRSAAVLTPTISHGHIQDTRRIHRSPGRKCFRAARSTARLQSLSNGSPMPWA